MTPERPAGKTLRADARRNRERVLEAAEELFAADGLTVPLDDIARRAGVGPGTVYRHFPTKEALFETVVLDRIRQMVERARGLADAENAGEAFFGYFTRAVEQASLNKAICEALQASTGLELQAASTLEREYREAIGVLLARAQQAGEVRADVTEGEVRALLVGCLSMRRWATGDQPGHLVTLVCDGLRPRTA